MASFSLQELVRGLDERPLRRLTTDWVGFFEGVVDVAGVRAVADAVLFTLTLPTTPHDFNDFIHVADIERNTTDKIRLRQSDADLPATVVGILRTGTDARWMPGPDAYHLRMQISGVTTPFQTPLVLQLLDDSNPPQVLAEATGASPIREDINDILASSVITRPLLEQLRHATLDEQFDVIIDVNLQAADRREAALGRVRDLVNTVTGGRPLTDRGTEQYLFERLMKSEIEALVRLDATSSSADKDTAGSIHRIWPDFQVHSLLNRSIPTIKADAARGRVLRGRSWYPVGGHRFGRRRAAQPLRAAQEPGADRPERDASQLPRRHRGSRGARRRLRPRHTRGRHHRGRATTRPGSLRTREGARRDRERDHHPQTAHRAPRRCARV